jgi:hypothetical protein
VPVDIANYMLNARSEAIADIKKRYNIDICILANPQLLDQRFLLKRIKINEERGAGAAEQFMKLDEKSIDENTPTWQVDKMNAKNNQPMGSAMTSKHPQKAKSSGLLKRLWNKLFGQAEKPKNTRGGRSGNQNRRRSPQRKRGPNASNNQAQQQNREDGKNRSNNRSSGRTRGPNRTRRRQNNHETSNF